MRNLPRVVLAIGAHPDDLELLCAGTLARFLEAGSVVHLAVACRGDRGGSQGPDPVLADRRKEESRQAAECLGVPITFLDFGDAEVYDSPEARARFIHLLRSVRPELVITHGPDDYHDDHVRVGELTAKCSWFSASGGQRTDQPPLDQPPTLVYMDNIAGVGCEPTHLVDISPAFDMKQRMLACHVSQTGRSDGGVHQLAELAEVQSRLRGFQCGVQYAEGFRAAPLWGRRRPEPLLP
ncbi:PIG-L family deacetylase [soil metagenome]